MTQPPALTARGRFHCSIPKVLGRRCGADSGTGQGIKLDGALLTEKAGTVQRGTCPSRGQFLMLQAKMGKRRMW